MPHTVAMYEKSFAHLDALGLDIAMRTFGPDGTFRIDGAALPSAGIAVDYFWPSSHVTADGSRKTAA